MEKRKSRTFQMTDEEWEYVTKAAIIAGFGPNSRGRAMAYLAKTCVAKEAARIKREAAKRDDS